MTRDPEALLSDKRRGSTLWNLWNALRRAGPMADGRWDRTLLDRYFGSDTTERVRRALAQHWLTIKPSLRSERSDPDKNSDAGVWLLGAIGIDALSEQPGWAAALNAGQAALAVRYALFAIDRLPPWLVPLCDAHERVVEDMIGRELASELDEPLPPQGGWHSMLLQALRWGVPELAKRFVPSAADWLQGEIARRSHAAWTQPIAERIEQVVGFVVVHGDAPTRAALADLAAAELAAVGTDPPCQFWLSVLARIDTAHAVAQLLRKLETLSVEEGGAAVRLIGQLLGRRRADPAFNLADAKLDPQQLLALTVEVRRHVLPAHDAPLRSVYTPTTRDHAENARRAVLDALLQTRGHSALKAKIKLSMNPLFADLQDHIRTVARERLADEVDATEAHPEDVRAMLQGDELPPRTQPAMARLLVDRLDDLQDLMLRDASPRAAWAVVTQENDLRPAIAREFDVARRGAYTVDQEAVTADGKETDIRLRSTHGPQATIELKIGDKRSATDLRDALANQLVRKYMAASNARTGCLLVSVSSARKRWKHPETGEPIDRHGLQSLLDDAARQAQESLGGDGLVVARVLDLTPRLESEAVGAKSRGALS